MTAFEPGASEVLTVGETRSPRATALRASSPAPTITVGLEVLVQDVMAAIATDPCPNGGASSAPAIGWRWAPSVCGKARAEVVAEARQRDAVLRPARPGQRRLDGREVELEGDVELGPVAGLAPQALGLGVALDEVDARLPAARSAAGR